MNAPIEPAGSERIHVLHADDDRGFAELTAEFLEREDERIDVETVASASEGLDRLESVDIDCVVSDYDMPGTTGIEFLEAVRETYADLPFILFTGKGSEEVASEAISAGVTDYLQKEPGTNQYTILANRIGNAVDGYRARRAAEASESRRQQMFERITDGFFAVDTDWRYTAVNEEGAQLVGRTRDELIGERVWDAFPALVDTPFEEALRTAMESTETLSIEAEYPPLDAWFNVRVYSDTDGISIFFRDVTDQREREQRVETLARRFDAVFDNPLTMLGLLAPDGTLLEVNGTALDLIGSSAEEVTGDPFWETPWWNHSPELQDRLRSWISRAADGEYVRYEAEHPNREGEMSTIDGIIHPVRNDAGLVTELVAVARDITAQKRREERLQQVTTRLEALFENSPDMMDVHDADGTIVDVNEQICDELGYTEGELLGTKVWEIDRRLGSEEANDIWADMETGDTHRRESRFERRDGSTFPVEVHLARLRFDGEDRFLVASRDVTERKERETELAFRTSLLEAQAETTIDGILVVDDDRNVVFSNERFLTIWDIPESVASARSERVWLDHVSDQFEDPDEFRAHVEHLYEHPEAESRDTVQLPDGRWLDRYSAPVVDDDGTYYGRLWTVRDVTERETHKRRIETLHDVTRDLVQAGSPEEIAAIAVEAARDVLDLPVTGCWLYHEADDVLDPAAATDEAGVLVGDHPTYERGEGLSWAAFESGDVAVYDDLSTVDGTVNPDTSIRSEIIVPLGGHGVLNVGSFEPDAFDDADVSLAKILGKNVEAALARAERERELSRQNERLEQFANIVSHDIQNPLNVLEGSLELARETGDSEQFTRCNRAIDRIQTLIDDLLLLARSGETVGETDDVDLAWIANGCWETVETDTATLNVTADGVIRVDRSRFRQLLENLYRNAVEHGGPEVTVTVGDLEDGAGFFLEDDGPGIPADERDDVFESGYSTSSEGTGFGLAIVEAIAEAHGWDVRLTESDTGGARFEFTGVDVVE